ncbi:unnamed protein product [Oppiella nova]|uniref:Uncharacterized protein n=1 Tax=Oppiella nova TaxID=334625 RepID=A0A7R9MH53_9ACAR|nr:unnamed protein product [Oppiella nova]CAG2177258.1 unnamed protein product [Oppiella nova]
MKELEKSCKEFEESRTSVMDDCNELRTTLMEVEKSRLDIRRELNDYKINSSSLENKLKSKDNELQDVKRRLEAIKNERNSLKDSLDSSSKSLTQLKDMNTNLTQRNKQLMAQMSFSENERREFEKQLSFSSTAITDRENNVSLLKKDNESLKELVKKLENEKKRLERSYSLIEKEKYVLKNSLDDFQRKSSKVFDNSHNNHSNDVIIDEAKIITQGLAALELKNIELQRKVQGLQSLMNETEGLNGTDSDHPVNGSASDDLQRLRLAQKHAEELIDRKDFSSKHLSNYEKELSRFSLSPSLTTTPPRFKEPPIRSHSVSRTGHLKHQNTDTSTPLPSYSSTSGSNNAKRKLNYNKN